MTAPEPYELPLTKGYVALIDAEDVELALSAGSWQALERSHTTYAIHGLRRGCVSLQVFLMGMPLVDHIDGDGLNNQRSNLRAATPLQNAWNIAKRSNNTSGYKGVHLFKRTGRYRALIRIGHGRRISLGYFSTPEEAALAYDHAAREHHGKFACLNFPRTGERSAR